MYLFYDFFNREILKIFKNFIIEKIAANWKLLSSLKIDCSEFTAFRTSNAANSNHLTRTVKVTKPGELEYLQRNAAN